MHPFDVDTGAELLTAPKRSDEDVWWQVSERQQQAKSRHRTWMIAATALSVVAAVLSVAALVTSAVANSRSSISNAGSFGRRSSSDVSKTPGWGQIQRVAFSSCTSYDVR
jgi:hypothetical protein